MGLYEKVKFLSLFQKTERMDEDKRKQEYTNDEVEIVDLDVDRPSFLTWQKHTFATFSQHKRAWIASSSVSLCILLLATVFQVPMVRNSVWSKVSGEGVMNYTRTLQDTSIISEMTPSPFSNCSNTLKMYGYNSLYPFTHHACLQYRITITHTYCTPRNTLTHIIKISRGSKTVCTRM